ncbi:MAG: mannonate dehydratase [Epsilonproteobacteria bacterium]|nr:mannonate dehydratase [Campylobacterota bacterium]
MKMTFRWYGKDDKIPLRYIAQIPGIDGVVASLIDIPVGEVWPISELIKLKDCINSYSLNFEVIESVNVHESIKLGEKSRDKYIENYKQTLKNLSNIGIKTVCYNFMPIFDWTRTNLAKPLSDKSTVLSFDYDMLKDLEPNDLFDIVKNGSADVVLPGWELDRLNEIEELFQKYKNINEENLWSNLKYFLQEIIPVAQECDINMAIHPDDPPWSIFGLPRIITCKENLQRLVDLVDSPRNGITLCSGSLGPRKDNDIPDLIRYFGAQNKIHFAHVRNIKSTNTYSFYETAHLSDEGNLDIYEIMKAYDDIGFKGCIRPDHGRMIWGEVGMPGYGLYDRALGIAYFNGINEAIKKAKNV